MRIFYFKAKNIGEEKYLTYTMGEDCELDEGVLDSLEEEQQKDLIDIIYEEDEDYDYLTYDITNRVSLDEYIGGRMNSRKVLLILRNIANGLISLRERAIPLSYILMNRSFIYVAGDNYDISFICLPIESKGAVAAEFKGFIRELLANMRYDVDEELGYVGKLITYINGDNFNLRGLVGLSEALMEEAGIGFEQAETIGADGVEILNSETPEDAGDVSSFMNTMASADEKLPEIGDEDDEEDEEEAAPVADEELDSILPDSLKRKVEANEAVADKIDTVNEEAAEAARKETVNAQAEKETARKETVNAQAEKETARKETGSTATDTEAGNDTKASANTKTARTTASTRANIPEEKEKDIDILKNRLQELVGNQTTVAEPKDKTKPIKTIEDLDNYFDSKPPVIKKSVVKVNRAALIQSAAEHEDSGFTGELANEEAPEEKAAEEAAVAANADAAAKPKSASILSKTVEMVKSNSTTPIAPKAIPYLIRVNTDERIMLNKDTFKLGKGARVDYIVTGNGAISRLHASIIQRDGVCYIKDNKSTNHTYVNDKMVEEGAEEILTHDSIIRLGDEEFRFKIR